MKTATGDNGKLIGRRVAILATDGVEEDELTGPREALDDAGAETTLINVSDKKIKSWKLTDWGKSFSPDMTLEEADPADFDALVLPGGVMNPDKLRMKPKAVAFVKAFFNANKPVAAICHGPWLLAEANVARGRKMTSWPSIKMDLINAGARWVDQASVVDGNLVTSRKPDDIPAFNEALIELLAEAAEPVGAR